MQRGSIIARCVLRIIGDCPWRLQRGSIIARCALRISKDTLQGSGQLPLDQKQLRRPSRKGQRGKIVLYKNRRQTRRLFLFDNGEGEIVELGFVDGGWGIHHEVDAGAILREGDDVADVVDGF